MEDPKNGRLSTDAELVRSIRRTRDRNGFRVGLAGGAVALLALVSTVRAQPGVGFGIYPAVGPYTEPLVARVGLSSYSPDLWSGWAFARTCIMGTATWGCRPTPPSIACW